VKKELIYLGNISYFNEGAPFPLSAGYISAFTKVNFPNQFEIKTFNDPSELEYCLKHKPPRILGLSNYSWNRNINSQFVKYAKSISKNNITVFGGPCFAANDSKWLNIFFEENSGLDFYVQGEGEKRFSKLVESCLKYDYSIKRVRENLPRGIFYKDRKVCEGREEINIHQDSLDDMPSPYLTGTLDKFFNIHGMIPIVETVRGCPYSCTFCCWGDPSFNRIHSYSVNRVKDELAYIASRTKSKQLIITDGNFGILDRDVEIAKYVRELSIKKDYPKNIYIYFDKNNHKRIVSIAKIFGKLIQVSLARQSLNKNVLSNIKRTNINDVIFSKVKQQLKEFNIESKIELIYPLPGETKSTFIRGICKLLKQIDFRNMEIRIYPTELLPGSEMATNKSRKKYKIRSAWRPIDKAYNKKFTQIGACEYHEIIISTNTFSMDDFFYIRRLHFFLCIFLTYRIYQKIVELYYSINHKRDFIWFIGKMLSVISFQNGVLAEFFDKFEKDIRNELIDSKKYNENSEYKLYRDTTMRRINIYYMIKLLYEDNRKYHFAFMKLVQEMFISYLKIDKKEIDKAMQDIEENIFDFVKIEQWLKEGNLKENIKEIPHDFFVIEEFSKNYNGNIVDTLDKVHYMAYPGHFNKLVLINN